MNSEIRVKEEPESKVEFFIKLGENASFPFPMLTTGFVKLCTKFVCEALPIGFQRQKMFEKYDSLCSSSWSDQSWKNTRF